MKVNYLGTQYVHKFINSEGEVKYVTCSNEDFSKITKKPAIEGYEYQYSVGGIPEVDTQTKLLGESEFYEFEGKTITQVSEENGEVRYQYN